MYQRRCLHAQNEYNGKQTKEGQVAKLQFLEKRWVGVHGQLNGQLKLVPFHQQ